MKPISPEATNLTGFTVIHSQLYRHGVQMQTIPLSILLNHFINFLRCYNRPLLVAHNAKGFDTPVLMRVLAENGLQQRFREVVSGFVDTLQLSKLIYPNLPSYSLTNLAEHFLQQNFNAHNGLEDAKILQRLFKTWSPHPSYITVCTNRI